MKRFSVPRESQQQGDLFTDSPRVEALPPPPPRVAPPPPRVEAPPPPIPSPPPKEARTKVVLSVGDLTRNIKGTLERGFSSVCVRGEISGYRGPNPRGHLYFSLKDADACIDVKMWSSVVARLKFKPREGLEVVVEGSVDVYEPQGRYSLIVQRLEPVGEGALALAFGQLKERLQAEGLFGERRIRAPRPIPFLPRRIGIVTSIHGAALKDFLRILHRRHPRLSVLICHARVQGEGASFEVVSALQRLARMDVDVIVVTRGGGSVEDLWTFNEERVARAIHACPVPVVSAIGHEVDITIADFVADFRAPTPSAAAEKLAPVLKDLELALQGHAVRLRKAAERHVLADRQRLHRSSVRLSDPRRVLGQKRLHLNEELRRMLEVLRRQLQRNAAAQRALADRLNRQQPQARVQRNRQELTRLEDRLHASLRAVVAPKRRALSDLRVAFERCSPKPLLSSERKRMDGLGARMLGLLRETVSDEHTRFHRLTGTLEALSPLKVLARGYSVTFRRDTQEVVRRAADVQVGDALAIRVANTGARVLGECDEIDVTVTGVK